MKLEEALEMSYPRALVQQIILGLTDPLNQHLVKLAGFQFPPEQRQHFRREVRTWLDKIQRLRNQAAAPTRIIQILLRFAVRLPFRRGRDPEHAHHDGSQPRGIRPYADHIARGTRRVAAAISHPTCRSPSPRPSGPRFGPGLAAAALVRPKVLHSEQSEVIPVPPDRAPRNQDRVVA